MDIDMEVYHAELRRRLRVAEGGRAARAEGGVYAALPAVPALLAGKDVLITGASGFLGRVLLEKLLRSCPDVGAVFLLLRAKKGVPPRERLADIVGVPIDRIRGLLAASLLQLFEQLVREQPGALSKLVAVAGDCSEPGLGLADGDRALLRERVAFVFHGAASVRFDDPVRKAVQLNTRGAREVVELCAGMARLEALVHISTAFTNINQHLLEEKLYPTQHDWRTVVQAVSDDERAKTMDDLGPKLLGFHPNSYTFSKALAEQIMGEAASTLPVIIVRPAVVIGAAKEPLKGWLDNVNSPAAFWAAVNKGVLRVTQLHHDDAVQDFVPVDLVTKATIMAAWVCATKQAFKECRFSEQDFLDDSVPVVNLAITDVHPVPGWAMKDIFERYCRRATPYSGAVRYPAILPVDNNFLYAVLYFVYHLMFGFGVDLLLRLAGRKPRLIRVYRKIAAASDAVGVFVRRRFYFKTNNFWKLQLLMHPKDVADFDFDLDSLDPRIDCKNQMIGILEYAFKEKFDREKGLRQIDRLFWIEMIIYVLLAISTLYFLKQMYFAPRIL